jgi:DNA replication initiation complex subunit (GINS family)
MTQQQAAELRYEAGMYQSLYETAKKRIEALEAALQDANAAYDHGFRAGTATRADRIEALEAALREVVKTWDRKDVDEIALRALAGMHKFTDANGPGE